MPSTVATYLIDRLTALGAEHVFGVPGNYTAEFLQAARASGRLHYVGTRSELEAGYAADAYARLRPIGVACVTYGVGSLSLYNAVAGAFVERCPVVVLNGSAKASKAEQMVKQGILFAHAIDPVHTDELIFRPIAAATAVLTDAADAPQEIDRVLRACVAESRPVYLEVRDGVWSAPCPAPANPGAKLVPLPRSPAEEADVDRAVVAAVADVLRRMGEASSPVLWGGEWLQRLRLQDEFEEIVRLTKWAYTTTLMGKSLISEKNDRFIGVYDSAFARGAIRQVVEVEADCLLALGTILSDFYGPIVAKKFDRMILAAAGAVRVGSYVYPNVPLDRFVRRLLEELRLAKGVAKKQSPPAGFQEIVKARAARRAAPAAAAAGLVAVDPKLTWDSFFARMRRVSWKGLRVLVDTGMALFPSAELPIEERDHFIAQTAWLSIGYTTGAAVGVSFAAPGERVVTFTGDGGFQMLPQVLSTLAHEKKAAIFFVFNNGLYAIEQFLINKDFFKPANAPPPEFFNELPAWDYPKLAEAFGARGFRATTAAELETALETALLLTDVPALIEVRLDPKDLPAELRAAVPGVAGAAAAMAATGPATVVNMAAFN